MTEEEIRKAEATLFVDAVIGITLMFLLVWLISPIVFKTNVGTAAYDSEYYLEFGV